MTGSHLASNSTRASIYSDMYRAWFDVYNSRHDVSVRLGVSFAEGSAYGVCIKSQYDRAIRNVCERSGCTGCSAIEIRPTVAGCKRLEWLGLLESWRDMVTVVQGGTFMREGREYCLFELRRLGTRWPKPKPVGGQRKPRKRGRPSNDELWERRKRAERAERRAELKRQRGSDE